MLPSRPAGGGRPAAGLAAAPVPSPMAGTPFGRYSLAARLGEGGMGVVWKAWDAQLGRWVALKQVHSGVGDRATAERFLREARLAARLRHPGIVQVHDVGEVDGVPFFTAELIEGSSLHDRATPRLSARDAATLAGHVAEALAFAHEQSVIHRDVKPSNILIDPAGRPRLADFGLARDLGAGGAGAPLTQSGALVGTPEYMSPEQASGRRDAVGPASDQFSLGAVLYELLTGRPPFEGDSLRAILNAVADRDPEPPRRLAPDIPPELESVCLRALEKDPTQRFATMRAFAEDLRRCRDGEPVAWASGRGRGLVRFARARARWIVALAILCVVAGLAAAVRLRSGAAVRTVLAQAAAHRSAGEVERAREAYARALDADPADREARAGLEWAAAESARRAQADAEAARQLARTAESSAQELLSKAARVSRVLARWHALLEPLHALDASYHDFSLAPEARRAGPERWAPFQRFLDETPDDPASRATARALAGWAWYLSGRPQEGLAWMAEAAALDPDVPYGRLVEALVDLGACIERQALPGFTVDQGHIRLGRPPGESAELASIRRDVERLLEAAAKARVWGREGAEDLSVLLEALRAWQSGEVAEAERAFGRALELPDLRAFEADFRVGRGKMRYLLGRSQDALEDFEAAARVRPRDVNLRNALGSCRLADAEASFTRDRDGVPAARAAIADLEFVLSLVPSSASALDTLGTAHAFLANAAMAAGEDPLPAWARALDAYARALALQPGLFELRANRVDVRVRIAAWRARRGEDAEEEILAALEELVDPPIEGRAWFAYRRGSVLVLMGELEAAAGRDPVSAFERALPPLTQAIALAPDAAEPYAARSAAHRGLAQAAARARADDASHFLRAVADAERAAALDPKSPTMRLALARVHSARADVEVERGADPRADADRAIAACDAALEVSPDFRDARLVRAGVLRLRAAAPPRAGEDTRPLLTRSIAEFDDLLARRPADEVARNGRGIARLDLADAETVRGGDPRETLLGAIEDFDRSLAVDSRRAPAWHNRAAAWTALARAQLARRMPEAGESFRHARDDAERAVALEPEHWPGWANLGVALGMLGDLDGAERAFHEALRRKPDHVHTRLEAAAVQYNLGCRHALRAAGRESNTAAPRPIAAEVAAGERDAAFRHLDRAAELGWSDAEHSERDADLAALREDPRWAPWLGRLRGGK